ncbi:hypothetical protein FOZ62_029005 [Perkinsus olseni]|uniref:SLC41A/MgtE integral membrane domain-containing protein n=1 Tax=Perkinsus olseni TaxID=32597 RepID=A0A7J6TMX9_PEROL|nr:hypothetical protein FOZ62_029005 [Perkinsus olseni]
MRPHYPPHVPQGGMPMGPRGFPQRGPLPAMPTNWAAVPHSRPLNSNAPPFVQTSRYHLLPPQNGYHGDPPLPPGGPFPPPPIPNAASQPQPAPPLPNPGPVKRQEAEPDGGIGILWEERQRTPPSPPGRLMYLDITGRERVDEDKKEGKGEKEAQESHAPDRRGFFCPLREHLAARRLPSLAGPRPLTRDGVESMGRLPKTASPVWQSVKLLGVKTSNTPLDEALIAPLEPLMPPEMFDETGFDKSGYSLPYGNAITMCAVYASPSSISSSSGPIVVRPITDITQGPVAATCSAAFSPACGVGRRGISVHTPAAVAQLPGAASADEIPPNADGGVAVTVDDYDPEVPPDEEAFPVLPYQKASFLRKNWMRFPPLLITLLLELIPSLLYTEGSGALANLIGEDRADLFMGLRAVVTAVAGNFSLQNSSNMSRWLAMGIVTKGTWRREIWGEIKANLLTSLALSIVMMLTTGLGLCPWKLHDDISGENMWFGFVISLVLFLTANIGGLVGMLSPLLLQFVLKLDPAACAGPGETCFQDIVGSLIVVFVAQLLFMI